MTVSSFAAAGRGKIFVTLKSSVCSEAGAQDCDSRRLPGGKQFAAEQAAFAIAAAGGAVFAAVEDDLEVELVPGLAGEEAFEVGFRLDDVFAGREFPAGGEAVDVGVHGEGGDAEGLGHDDRGGLMADAGEGFERGEIGGDLAVVAFEQEVGEF